MDDHVYIFPTIEFVEQLKAVINVNFKWFVYGAGKVIANETFSTSNNIHSKIVSNIYSTIPKYKKGALIVSQT